MMGSSAAVVSDSAANLQQNRFSLGNENFESSYFRIQGGVGGTRAAPLKLFFIFYAVSAFPPHTPIFNLCYAANVQALFSRSSVSSMFAPSLDVVTILVISSYPYRNLLPCCVTCVLNLPIQEPWRNFSHAQMA